MINLREEINQISIDSSNNIPKIVKLLENPESPLALPRKICLADHDRLHVLLNQDLSADGEAFVVGFSMGNDPKTTRIHLMIYYFFSLYIYPKKYRFNKQNLKVFDCGFQYGRYVFQHLTKFSINQLDLSYFDEHSIELTREYLGINLDEIKGRLVKSQQNCQKQKIKKRGKEKLTQILQVSGSIFALLGGYLLASASSISGYGFIFLACSSSQMLLASILDRNILLTGYSASVFFGVDLYGVYNWLLK